MLGFSVMILGNTPDEVQAAIQEALPRGSHYGQCHEHEYEFARLFCELVPGVEKVTFCNSGTEATMYALRLAHTTSSSACGGVKLALQSHSLCSAPLRMRSYECRYKLRRTFRKLSSQI